MSLHVYASNDRGHWIDILFKTNPSGGNGGNSPGSDDLVFDETFEDLSLSDSAGHVRGNQAPRIARFKIH